MRSILTLALAISLSAAHARTQTSSDRFEGVWSGHVVAPHGSAEVGFEFVRGAQGLTARFHMPAMFAHGIDMGPAEIAGDTFVCAPLDTTLQLAGDTLTGTFAIPKLPIELRRGGTFAPEPPPPSIAAGPAPLWSRALGAETWATPVASGGVVYIGSTDGAFHALGVRDGAQHWKWKGSVPLYGEALVAQDALYFLDERCELVCLTRADGAVRWQLPLRADPTADVIDETFNHRTAVPVIEEGVVYVGSTDGFVHAVEAASGNTLWRHDAKTKFHAGVTLLGRDRLVAAGHDGTVLVLDRRTRKELARTQLARPVVTKPVIARDTLVVGCRDYMLYGLALADASIAWRHSLWFSWVESTPALVDGTLYVGSSDFRRVSAIDPLDGRPLWATDVRGLTWGSPVVTKDTVFAGTSAQRGALLAHEGGIVALDRKTGALRWRVPVPGSPSDARAGFIGSLAHADGVVIGASFDGTVSAYPAR